MNITADGNFSDLVYGVSLPQGASINYVKASGQFRIGEENGNLKVIGYGQGVPLSVAIQYQLTKAGSFDPLPILLALAAIAAAVLLFIFKDRVMPRRAKVEASGYDLGALTARQKKIMGYLINAGKPVTQGELERRLGLPKASLSRNLVSLEAKGLLQKEKAGMSNIIRLKK